MQQRPGYRAIDSMRKQRTQPALPGVTLPTVPIVAQPLHATMTSRSVRRTQRSGGKAVVLWSLALLLEGLYLALYPLLAGRAQANDPFREEYSFTGYGVVRSLWTDGGHLSRQPICSSTCSLSQ